MSEQRNTREAVEVEIPYLLFDDCMAEAERLGKPQEWAIEQYKQAIGLIATSNELQAGEA